MDSHLYPSSISDVLRVCRDEPETSSSEQPAGFQLILKVNLHEAAISAAAVCSGAGLLALADHSGGLSLIGLSAPAVLCARQLAEQPITALSFGTHSMQPQRAPAGKRAEAVDSSAAEDRYQPLLSCAGCVRSGVGLNPAPCCCHGYLACGLSSCICKDTPEHDDRQPM